MIDILEDLEEPDLMAFSARYPIQAPAIAVPTPPIPKTTDTIVSDASMAWDFRLLCNSGSEICGCFNVIKHFHPLIFAMLSTFEWIFGRCSSFTALHSRTGLENWSGVSGRLNLK